MTRKNKDVEDWFQKELSKLFDETGFGFVFGNKQLEEYIKKQREQGYEGKFVTLPNFGGGICREDTIDTFLTKYKELCKERKNRLNSILTMDEYIEEKLSDYECYYTGDYLEMNMVEAVRDVFPNAKENDFERVYNKTKNNH